jgi:hypothetical protein
MRIDAHGPAPDDTHVVAHVLAFARAHLDSNADDVDAADDEDVDAGVALLTNRVVAARVAIVCWTSHAKVR